MADSKHGQLDAHGLMVAAMAWRVKYRETDAAGQATKIIVRIEYVGVHKKNRGTLNLPQEEKAPSAIS